MEKKQRPIVRLAVNAVMVAVYIALSMLAIQIGGLKITFEHFPVVLIAVLYGPTDAMLIGGVGEFINQLNSFGVTPTTALWVLPIIVRAFLLGTGTKLFEKWMNKDAIIRKKIPLFFLIVCVLTGIISSCLNTLAFYVDSKMFGYYKYELVFGALLVRLLLSALTSVIIVIAIKPILHALKKAQLI